MVAIIITAVLAVLWYLAIDDIVAAHKYKKECKKDDDN
jgi:hypothetical protein